MLKPGYLEKLPERLIELYAQVERDILADMARRISTYNFFIPAAEFQFKKLQEMGLLRNEIICKLTAITGIAQDEIERLMDEAGAVALEVDDSIYRKAGLEVTPFDADPVLQEILKIGIEKTRGLFDNLTRTTANTATKQFENTLDRVYMQITTGAFDYNSAIRSSVKDLASKGVAVIEYPTGHIDYMDVAVRRATVTGVNQTAAKLQEARADEMGCDLVETTAHAGARPTHEVWQGKIFSRSGTHPKYPDFVKETGYGTGPGLCGWNCRHSFFPFIEGVSEPAYTEEELAKMNAKDYTYNGKSMTEYEATQKQRYIERQIRRWKREYEGMKAAGQPTEEAAAKIAHWNNVQKDFLKQTGLKRQTDREQIAGFGRGEASKATHQAKVLETIEKDAIIKSQSDLPKKISLPDELLRDTIDVSLPELKGIVPKGTLLSDVYVIAGDGTSIPIRDLRRLYAQYEGKPDKWQKKTGVAYTDNFGYEIHWYENQGFIPEMGAVLKRVKRK